MRANVFGAFYDSSLLEVPPIAALMCYQEFRHQHKFGYQTVEGNGDQESSSNPRYLASRANIFPYL